MTEVSTYPRPPGGDGPILWIRPSTGPRFVDLGSLWTHRELLFFFAWRDVKVRYKQSVLGITWILIQPVVQMLIFATVFGRIIGLPSDGVPYAFFVFAGVATWGYFASTVTKMSASLDGNSQLMAKVYFPRVVLPTSVMLGTLVDFAVVLPIVLAMAVYVRGGVLATWGFIPLAVVLMLGVTYGAGLWLAALNARYRDVILALPLLLQVAFYLSPVVFPSTVVSKIVGDQWLPVLSLVNPMFSVVETFRWATLGTAEPQPLALLMSVVSTLVLVVSGGFFFGSTEQTVVDRI